MWASLIANLVICAGCGAEIIGQTGRLAGKPDYWLTDVGNILQLIPVLVAGILYLRWQYRAVRMRREVNEFAYSPGWSVAYWFIPFLSLVRPFQVVKKLALTIPEAKTGHLQMWWAFWLISGIAGSISFRFPNPFTDLISAVAWIIAGVLFIPIFVSIESADQPDSMVEHIFG